MMRAMRKSWCLAAFCLSAAHPVAAETNRISFNRDIRPIMSDTCFRCHGPDKNARMVGLRLDIREEAMKPAMDGKIPIVPGKPDESEIIRRVFSTDSAEVMPPEFSPKALSMKETGASNRLSGLPSRRFQAREHR